MIAKTRKADTRAWSQGSAIWAEATRSPMHRNDGFEIAALVNRSEVVLPGKNSATIRHGAPSMKR